MGWSVGGRVEVQLGYVEKVRLYHGLGIDRLAPTKYQLEADMEKICDIFLFAPKQPK